MDKHIKAIGLAVLVLPVALAVAGLLEALGLIDGNKPWSWAALKWIVSMVCGGAYFLGLYLFEESRSNNNGDDE